MSWQELLIVIGTGFIAGIMNTLAGGGSLLTLPVLIFTGLPPVVANASNRVALFVQNIFAVAGFRSKGVVYGGFTWWLGLSALLGAIGGAFFAVEISGEAFKTILAVVMVLVVGVMLWDPIQEQQGSVRQGLREKLVSAFMFFFIGIYGGFIQAGTGFLIMGVLTLYNRFSLVKTNSIKVAVVLIYMTAALGVFIWKDVINWQAGLVLSIGNAAGAWVSSRLSVQKGDRWVKRLLVVIVVILAIRLVWGT